MKSLENDDLRREFAHLKQRFTDIVYDNSKEVDGLKYEREKKVSEMELLVKRSNEEIQLLEKKVQLLRGEMFNILEKRLDEENILIATVEKYFDPYKEIKEQLSDLKYSQVLTKSYEKAKQGRKFDSWRFVPIPDDFRMAYENSFK